MLPRLLPAATNTATARPVAPRRFPSHLTRSAAVARRLFSAVASAPQYEQVSVPCRSNGLVKLDIFHASSPSSPILIYLPPGPVIPPHDEEENRLISTLAASSKSTIARINYRFSPEYPWPTPLHDVTTAYDWVKENLLLNQPPLARLGVCGELVGGSLATTLALTECALGTSRIVAAAVNNPIADWVFPDDLTAPEPSQLPEPNAPDETSFPANDDMMTWWTQQDGKDGQEPPSKKGRKRVKRPVLSSWESNSDNAIIPTLTLSGARDVLFSKPEHYFDRFASPIHFFRSPHGKLIYPQDDDIFASSPPSEASIDPLDIETRMDISHYESSSESAKPPEVPILARCRAYARIYPPSNSNLSLPEWRITAGSQSPLLDQASELARMIKRGIARQTLRSRTARIHWQDPAEKKKYEAYAEQRMHLDKLSGVGLWTLSDLSEPTSQIEEVGKWMSVALARPD